MTQVEIVENNPSKPKHKEKERQIIKQLEPEKPIDSDDQARFESEKTQRVKVETKASQIGLTSNKTSKASSRGETEQPRKPQQPQPQKNRADDGDLPEFTRLVSGKNSQFETAKINIELPGDIQNANATNLNTDATTYYSFYSRVEELFYVRWVERVDYYWNRIPFEIKRDKLYGHSWRTQITVLLDSKGVYDSSIIERSSGYEPFDEAVVYAFKNAHYFPNVPKAKVEPDGFVRLRYSFHLNIGPYR